MLDLEGLHLRAALFQSIRCFFKNQGFLEVDTPVRQPVLIPEANIVPVTTGGASFLQTSPEQCMKRLLARGGELIFQICPCFRAEERGRKHLEEFTMLEWYRTGADYHALMEDCQELIQYVVDDLRSNDRFEALVEKSCLADAGDGQPWQKSSVESAFARYCPISMDEAMNSNLFDEMLVEHIEPQLGFDRPHFLTDYPALYASLARKKKEDSRLAERFELYINGLELANGFSELTDAVEQRQRFEEEISLIKKTRQHSAEIPERFLEDLEKIDTAAGIAFGVDRLMMLILSVDSINDVVSFSPGEI